jgi:aspartyl-tRNA(Asn)/glutamyl-tRNA(Gln) amidotransferase subunit A
MTRRQFLNIAGTAAALSTSSHVVRVQAQGAEIGKASPRSARERLEEALARIADPKGEGASACLTVYSEAARTAADAADARARVGTKLGPLDGTIVSIKDLFDVAGEPTRAGSKVLAQAKPAAADAPVVRRLRAAGAVIVAKTNMTEFAFSILGINPHYGTPGNPADRTRVPGGSSSGAAVAVADGMCDIAIGSDTGGSVRTPAAFCGIVGFKPSKFRVPTDGAFPLSHTLDSVGPLARTVAECAAADAVIAGEESWKVEPEPLGGLRLGIPQGRPLAELDQVVDAKFSDAVKQVGQAGVRFSDERLTQLDEMAKVSAKAAITTIEAFAIHRELLTARAADYDPFVRGRLEGGRDVSAADYIALMRARAALVREMDARLSDLDGLVMPTTPIVAPTVAEVSASFEAFMAKQVLGFRNTSMINFFDLCAISLPLPRDGSLPVGLMLVARNAQDRKLLRMAAAVERLFAG